MAGCPVVDQAAGPGVGTTGLVQVAGSPIEPDPLAGASTVGGSPKAEAAHAEGPVTSAVGDAGGVAPQPALVSVTGSFSGGTCGAPQFAGSTTGAPAAGVTPVVATSPGVAHAVVTSPGVATPAVGVPGVGTMGREGGGGGAT